MKIRIFMFRKANRAYVTRLRDQFAFVFGEHLENGDAVSVHETINDAADLAAEAFKEAHAVLFFAEPALFADTKKVLSKALGFSLKCDPGLLEAAAAAKNETADESSAFAYEHAFVPEKAKLFRSADGLYNGFSLESGNQTFYLLPLESGKTELAVTGAVIPHINMLYGVNIDVGRFREFNAARLREAVTQRDVKIAVAGTNTATFFKDYIGADPVLTERVILSRHAEKRSSLAPVEYVRNISITAAEFSSCPYGVAISNAFYTGSSSDAEKTVYLAVTNEYQTAVREIRSVPGEDIPSLFSRSCADLCTFIADIIENDTGKSLLAEQYEKKVSNRFKAGMIVTAVLIAAVSAFCLIYFSLNGYSFRTWFADMKAALFPGSSIAVEDEVETLEALVTDGGQTTEEASSAQSEAVIVTAAPTTDVTYAEERYEPESVTDEPSVPAEEPPSEEETPAPTEEESQYSEEGGEPEIPSEEPGEEFG